MNPYVSPKTGSDGGGSPLKECRPPGIVKISIGGIALTLSLGIAKLIYLASLRGTFRLEQIGRFVGFLVAMSILAGVIFLLLRGLYRGSKFAFWIVIANAALTVISIKYSVSQYARYETQWEKALFLFQGCVQLSSAAALLFPRSWRWFHDRKSSDSSGADPADEH